MLKKVMRNSEAIVSFSYLHQARKQQFWCELVNKPPEVYAFAAATSHCQDLAESGEDKEIFGDV
jgi:hypothetical protein